MRKSYYCEKLEKTLHFLPDGIKFCCSCSEGAGVKIDDFSSIDKGKILKKRQYYIELLNNGQIPPECSTCSEYKQKSFKEQLFSFFKINKKTKTSHIIVDHFKQCDCRCIYCSQKRMYPAVTQSYELLPIIKDFYKSKLINDTGELKVEFQGGNISVLNEFEALIKEFKEHNCDDFVILMNGIKYMPLLETIANNEKSHICISLDAGTKETFEKIKSVDAFDIVIENIKKLKEKTSASISLKYIIIKGVNDNLRELKKFLRIAKEIGGIKPLILEIDYNDTLFSPNRKFDIPSHYYELFEYAQNYCRKNDIEYLVYPYTKSLLDVC